MRHSIRLLSLKAMIVLLFAGNIFGFINLVFLSEAFFQQYPDLSIFGMILLKMLPVFNIISLIGLWLYKKWAIWLSIGCYLIVASIDLYLSIYYHLIIATISSCLLFMLIYFNRFKFHRHLSSTI